MSEIQFVNVSDDRLIDTVAVLARDIWTEHYTPIIGKAQVEYMLDKFQSRSAIARQIEIEGFLYYLLKKKDGRYAGYIGVVPKQGAEELFLSKLYVLSGERGKGSARKAVQFVQEIARQKNTKKITLTVNKHNAGTIRAYEKLGFRNIGSVVTDIGQGYVMDDYRMEMVLDNR